MTPEERLRELRRQPKATVEGSSDLVPEVPLRPHELPDELVADVVTSDGPPLEVVGFYEDRVERVTWVDHDDAGRPVRFETATTHHDARGVSTEIAECEWEGDRCVRVRWRETDDGKHWWEHVDEGFYDERGLARRADARAGGATWPAAPRHPLPAGAHRAGGR